MNKPDPMLLAQEWPSLKTPLKLGDYDGAQLMRAWCCADQMAESIQRLTAVNADLLQALQAAVSYAEKLERALALHERNATLDPARAAIAKATGEQ